MTPRTSRIVARKGTVVMVRIANNHGVPINTTLRVRISAGGMNVDETFPMQIEAGDVMKRYLFADQPIMFPAGQTGSPIAVIAEIVDPGSAGLSPTDCRLGNDRIVNRTTWKVVTTDPKFSLLWAKVGTLLDIGNYAPDSHFDEIDELGTGYIRAVFPLHRTEFEQSAARHPAAAGHGGRRLPGLGVCSGFGLPADAIEPVVLTFELNGVAALLPYSRLMGVLPEQGLVRALFARGAT